MYITILRVEVDMHGRGMKKWGTEKLKVSGYEGFEINDYCHD